MLNAVIRFWLSIDCNLLQQQKIPNSLVTWGMMLFVSMILCLLAIFVAVPVFVFSLEIVAGLLCSSRDPENVQGSIRPRVAVLIPAHNESAGIRTVLENVKAQLSTNDRLVVVADNCTDNTAAISEANGAEVIVRNDQTNMGKGHALDFGIAHLTADPPAVLIIIDADCTFSEGSINQLANACAITKRPLQALNLMTAPPGTSISYDVAEFAWRVKNWLRPDGLNALNLPCQLMGTGMAFPWELIRVVSVSKDSMVEDMKLGFDLAEAGAPPLFFPSAKVTSHFPWSVEGAISQRKRWEGGHIGMIFAVVPRSFYDAIKRKNLELFALTLDLIVPPLSFLSVLAITIFILTMLAAILGVSVLAFAISVTSFLIMAIAVFLSWLKCGRDILPPKRVIQVPLYVAGKIPLYLKVLFHREPPKWVRTDREMATTVPANSAEQSPVVSARAMSEPEPTVATK